MSKVAKRTHLLTIRGTRRKEKERKGTKKRMDFKEEKMESKINTNNQTKH